MVKSQRTDANLQRRDLYGLLGDLPERDRPIGVVKSAEVNRDGFIVETLEFDLNGLEPVPAYFVRPEKTAGLMPVILYNHAHGGDYALGKDELIDGRGILQAPTYALELTRHGWCALCIDAWAFGDRRFPAEQNKSRRVRTESEIFKEMLWHGRVMWGMMVYDSLRAVDYLVSRADVDPDRIGTLGISMGGTMAWWTAALDPRLKLCVDIGSLTDYQALIEARSLDEHGIYYYVPGLLKHFTAAKINALITPRPHLGLAGNLDPLTPPGGLDRIDAELRAAYAAAGVPDAWKLLRYDVGHQETPDMRAEIIEFLERWL